MVSTVQEQTEPGSWLSQPAQAGSYIKGKYASPGGVSCWKVEGFSPKFYENLRRLSLYFYRKYPVAEHREFYLDMIRSKVEDALQGHYDPSKSSIKTFICTVIYNEITRINSKNSKAPSYGDNLDLVISAGTQHRTYIPDRFFNDHQRRHDPVDTYADLAVSWGITIDRELITMHINESRITPHAWAYLWLLRSGRLEGATA